MMLYIVSTIMYVILFERLTRVVLGGDSKPFFSILFQRW